MRVIAVLSGGATGGRYVEVPFATPRLEQPTFELCGGFGADLWQIESHIAPLATYGYVGHRGCGVCK